MEHANLKQNDSSSYSGHCMHVMHVHRRPSQAARFVLTIASSLPRDPNLVKSSRAIPDRMVATVPPRKQPTLPALRCRDMSDRRPATELLYAKMIPAAITACQARAGTVSHSESYCRNARCTIYGSRVPQLQIAEYITLACMLAGPYTEVCASQ